MQTVTLEVTERSVPLTLDVSDDGGITMSVEQVREIYVDRPVYTGTQTVTPSSQTQTLRTDGKRIVGDITVAPVPSNYGLVTWNGSYLTIS